MKKRVLLTVAVIAGALFAVNPVNVRADEQGEDLSGGNDLCYENTNETLTYESPETTSSEESSDSEETSSKPDGEELVDDQTAVTSDSIVADEINTPEGTEEIVTLQSEGSADSDSADSESADAKERKAAALITVYNNVDYSSVYSFEFFQDTYADVREAFGNDGLATLKNFVEKGMAAGRQGCESFDVYSYKNAYQDLRLAFRNDLKKYYEHYIRCGKGEGRNSTKDVSEVVNPVTTLNGYDYKLVYDYAYYSENNADIKAAFGTDDVATLEHFVNCGMKEQRQGIATFDEKSYRRSYADLRRAFGNNYKSYYLHYINCGSKEKRNKLTGYDQIQDAVTSIGGVNYSLVYSYLYYVGKYADIKKVFGEDDLAVLKHFVNCGMNEQRQGIATFDEKSYRYSYADLRRAFGNNYKSYYLHYINNGSKEKRNKLTGYDEIQDAVTVLNGVDYSSIYDYLYYVKHNGDVKNAYGEDDLAVLKHFVNFGMSEKRLGIESVRGSFACEDLQCDNGTMKISVLFSSNSFVKVVYFPTWTITNDQDDIIWYQAALQYDGTWAAYVNIGKHNYETGDYIAHCYLDYGKWTSAFAGKIDFSVSDSVEFFTVVDSTSTATGIVQGYQDAETVTVDLWSNNGGQDDRRTYAAEKAATGWRVAFLKSNHGNAGFYTAELYVDGNYITVDTFSFDDNRTADTFSSISTAHAAGGAGASMANIYTNCIQAMDQAYNEGFRTLELDILLTSDGQPVMFHTWSTAILDNYKYSSSTNKGPTYSQFMSDTMYGGTYSTTDFKQVLTWLSSHSDVKVLMDTKYKTESEVRTVYQTMKNTASNMGLRSVMQKQIVPYFFDSNMYTWISTTVSFKEYQYATYPYYTSAFTTAKFKELCQFCKKNKVTMISMWDSLATKDIIKIADSYGITVYVHTTDSTATASEKLKLGAAGIITNNIIPSVAESLIAAA